MNLGLSISLDTTHTVKSTSTFGSGCANRQQERAMLRSECIAGLRLEYFASQFTNDGSATQSGCSPAFWRMQLRLQQDVENSVRALPQVCLAVRSELLADLGVTDRQSGAAFE